MLKSFDLPASNTRQNQYQQPNEQINHHTVTSNNMTESSTLPQNSSASMTTVASATNAAIAVVAPTARLTSNTSSNSSSSVGGGGGVSVGGNNINNITGNNGTSAPASVNSSVGSNSNINSGLNHTSGGGGGGLGSSIDRGGGGVNLVKNLNPLKMQNNILHMAAPRHIFHQHYHQIGTAGMQPTIGQWPLVEPVFHFGPGFEHQHYCPTHSQGPQPHEHVVFFHVNPGVSVTFQIAGNREIIRGPVTVPMVSQSGSPPIAMPVQVPPGHIMQQIVDENNTLRHVILSTSQHQQIHAGQNVVHTNVQSHVQGHFVSPTNNGPHYFNPMPANIPGPGTTPYFHPIPTNHGQPSPVQQAAPPPPLPPSMHAASAPQSAIYHKDERSQRQHTKLLKKLDQKQRDINLSPVSTISSRKPEMNGTNRTNESYDEVDESSNNQDQEDDETFSLIEQLSSVQSPVVSEVTSRSALLQWYAPLFSENASLNFSDLRYEVLLSDRGKEGKYKIIFKGASLSCRIRDLRPGQEYSVCLQVYLGESKGSASDATTFTTPACEPDQPLPPKLLARTKNSLQLRWNSPADNGAPIQQYVLEYDEGKGKEFVELFKMKGKQYSLSKLQPSTWYSFRLAVINECGRSAYSDVVTYTTSGNPPMQLPPPVLQNASSCSLCLSWIRRNDDEEFLLQISDCQSGHGFLPAYQGRATMYECINLKRSAIFQFRVRAENESGASVWSDVAVFETLPEKPGGPQKPHVKGKILPNKFKVKWDAPHDKGGTDNLIYHLEINGGDGFEKVYKGRETEAMCDRLKPGTVYQVRVMSENSAGTGPFSEICSVTTEAIVPSAPPSPYLGSPPSAFAAFIQWNKPDYNGGASLTEYELKLDQGIVYKGKDMYYVVKCLSPGQEYSVQVRAYNRIGFSLWSDELVFNAGATSPFPPEQPDVTVHSSSHVTVQWSEPPCNGAAITEYILIKSLNEQMDEPENVAKSSHRNICYRGVLNSVDLNDLTPFTSYYFKVCAVNAAGESHFSPIAHAQTMKAPPGVPVISSYETKPNEISIVWKQPVDNGSPILYYNVDCSDSIARTETAMTELIVDGLQPRTKYACRVQAVNEIGAGAFSASYQITTNSLPPKPPRLECTYCGYKTLALKWGEKPSSDLTFTLQMYSKNNREYRNIYVGNNCTMKLLKLQEQMSYSFRICCRDQTSEFGEYSEEYIIKTRGAPPKSIKEPDVINENGQTIQLEWQSSKNSFGDAIEYILQMSVNKKEFKQIYRGVETQYTLDKLPYVLNYMFRVCPVRVSPSEEIKGTFSGILRYKAESANIENAVAHAQHNSNASAIGGDYQETASAKGIIHKYIGNLFLNYSSRKKMTDQEKAIMVAISFMVITIGFASIVKFFIS